MTRAWDRIDRLVRRLERQGMENVEATGLGASNVSVDFRVPEPVGLAGMRSRNVASSLITDADGEVRTFIVRLPAVAEGGGRLRRAREATVAAIDATAISTDLEPVFGGASHRVLPHVQTVSDDMASLSNDDAVAAIGTVVETWFDAVKQSERRGRR